MWAASLTVVLSISRAIWKKEKSRSPGRGVIARFTGAVMNPCKVRKWVVSPFSASFVKCAPMCSEFGGLSECVPLAGVLYEQPPTQVPDSRLGQELVPGGQCRCQSIG